MRKFLGALGLCIWVGAAALPVVAETVEVRKSDVVLLLGQLPSFTPIRAELAELGFEGEKLDLAVAQFTRMLNDPLIAGNIADRIIAAQQTSVGSAAEAGGLFWPLMDRGLGHLDASEMRYFYRVEQAMLNGLSRRDCGLAIKERLAPRRLSTATGRVAARLDQASLQEYYRIQYKAARLGASRPVKKLNSAEEAKVVESINQALIKRVSGEKDAKALIAAFDNIDRVSNRRACEAGRLFIETVLMMEGRELNNALILLSTP